MHLCKKRIAVLCSGGGTDFQSVIDGCTSGQIHGEIVLMLSSASKAYAIERARQAGIPVSVIPKGRFADMDACNAARHAALAACNPDLIILAGFLGIVPAQTVKLFAGRIINIHPALLPKFGGRGMHGEHVHAAVLAAGESESGATVHFVDEGVDSGPIILQSHVPVLPDDTVQALAARVLETEHEILPYAAALFCQNRIELKEGKVRILPCN